MQRYKENYIIPYSGGLGSPAFKITDNLSFSYDDDVLVIYNVHLMNADDGLTASLSQWFNHNQGETPANKKIVYRFKTLDDGSYYLYNFTVTNNE